MVRSDLKVQRVLIDVLTFIKIHQWDHHVFRESWTHYFINESIPYQLSQHSLLAIPILID